MSEDAKELEKMVWEVVTRKVAKGHVEKIDDTFVYFKGERSNKPLIIPKKSIVEIK